MKMHIAPFGAARAAGVLGLLALLLASAGLFASPPEAGQDAPVAVVMKVDGDVSLVQEITETTTVEAPRTAERGDAFDRTVRVLAQAANSNARTSPNRQGMIRPLPGQVVKVRPRLGIAVASQRPTFVWRSFEGTEGYTIQIRRPGERPVRFQTSDTVFTLPADAEPLEPGETYHWTVAPTSTNRPAEEDSFRVMSAETETRLEEGIGAIEALGFDTGDDGRLLAAVVLADLGLYYDAARALDAIEEAGPLGPDVLMLKGEVLDELGRVEEAQEAFDRADRALR